MNAAEFAHFWELRGHRVVETKSAYWYNQQALFYLSIPYHRAISPSLSEQARVWIDGPAIGLRFPAISAGEGRPGGLFLCSNRDYNFGLLEKKARNQVRRGLENCVIEQIDFAYLAKRGLELHLETLARQQRHGGSMVEKQWLRMCEVAARTRDCQAWGALVNGQLAAFMATALVEKYFTILEQCSATAYLAHYPNNALVFSVTKEKLKDPRIEYVSYGLKSLENTVGLDHFKHQMGFQLKEWQDTIVFNPILKPFIGSKSRRIIDAIAHRFPKSELWRKARAMELIHN
ncbi:MAG: hypothetical protein JOZ48_15470 [Acidobacteriaceae bacterium]|nr:hypothetical protein [Acidobacteriaceae bacterium]